MRGRTKEKASYGSWKGFFRLLGSINLPWPVIALAFLAEIGYSQAMLMMPGTTASLMSGSLEPEALRSAVVYYVGYAAVLFADFLMLGLAGNWAVRNARTKVWGGMTRIRVDYYDEHTPSALSSAVTNDLQEAVSSLVRLIIQVIPAFYYIFAAMATVGQYDVLLMLSVLVLLPVKWIYMVAVSRRMYTASTGIYHRIGQLTGYLAERVKNLPLIKYYTNEDRELENGSIAVADLFAAQMRSVKVNCANSGIGTAINLLQHLVCIVTGVLLLQAGRITIEQWVAFFLFSSTISSRFGELIGMWQSLKSLQGMAARAVEIVEAPQEQSEQEAKAVASQEAVSKGAQSVEFRNVSFSYGEKKALKNVSFTVPAGTATAIVGLCGSGKTTLMNLLERF